MRFKKSNFVLSLLPVAATALPLVLASPAYAGGYYVGNGGQGGNADDAGMVNFGGIGGDGILGYDGGAGSGSGAESGTGGGGGGSGGGDGGAGGQGDGAAAPAGGAGGAMAGDNGDAGADALVDTSSGGGGGGGGAHGEIATDDVSYSGLTLLFGGVGGAGGVGGTPAGPDGGGGGGAGGAGGAGLFVQFNDVVVTNDGYIGGGNGGIGGAGGGIGNMAGGFGGEGGQGGVGIYVLGSGVTIINSGTIKGGTGGGYGTSFDFNAGRAGEAGYAIYGENINIINSGEIIAGQSGGHDGPAIVFAGTENRLELQDGWSITGDIYNFDEDTSGTFALGGDADSEINGHDFINFVGFMGDFEKIGASTWTVNSGFPMSVFGTIKEGTLKFSDGVTQEGDSLVTFWMTPAGTGRVTTDGAPIELDGALVIAYQPGVYTTGTHQLFAVENPDGPEDVVTGTFDAVYTAYDGFEGELPDGVEQEVIYNELDVLLSITGMSVAPTNTAAVSAPATTTLDNAQFANDLLLGALDTLTGTPDSGDAADNGGYVRMSYVEEVKVAGLMLPPPASTTTSVWGKALGRTTSIDATGGKSGVDAKSGGFMVGADRVVDGALTLGVAAGYSITEFEDDLGSDGTINTVRVAGYGRYTLGAVGIDAALGYAHDFFETDRAVAGLVANSDHGGDEVNAAVAVHVDYDFDGLVLTPKAGLRYTHLWENGYTETGAPGFNLTVARDTADSLQPFVGAKLAKVFHSAGGTKLTPSASIEYAREVLDAAPTSTVSVGGGSFVVKGVEPSRNRLSLGAGLGIAIDKNVSVQVGYKAVVPFDNFFEQTAEISAVWKF